MMTHQPLTLHVLTMNIHKGFSSFDVNFVLHKMRDALAELSSDLIFLQEVQGEHQKRAEQHPNWPEQSQYEFLADTIWKDFAYAKNAVYPHGHHGNAILSKYPILNSQQIDLSVNRWEQRGLLHCEILHPATQTKIHALCVHLNLLHRHREDQYRLLKDFITREIPIDAPLVLAGDFNDWSKKAEKALEGELNLQEAFQVISGKHARTFPSFFPILPLDRIYTRGWRVSETEVLKGEPWRKLSDHVGLWAELNLDESRKKS